LEESKLIESCLRNDRRAQKELVQQYAPVLLSVARRYSYAVIEPEDILQESFIQIFTYLHQFDPKKGKLFHWMRQIVINTSLKHFRTEKTKLNGFASLDELTGDLHHSEAEQILNYDAEHWIQMIQRLPYPYNVVFNMAAIDGYTHEDIAGILKIEVVTSRSYLHRARKLLLSMFRELKLIEHGS
jgi:RNA polymerase sigma-70 factor (ECF subfamily)